MKSQPQPHLCLSDWSYYIEGTAACLGNKQINGEEGGIERHHMLEKE